MASKSKLIRFPVFVEKDVLLRLDDASTEFGITRSAVVREALHRGLPAAVREYRRVRLDADRQSVPPRRKPAAPSQPDGDSDTLTLSNAVIKLCAYVDGIRARGRTIADDALKDLLEIHATAIGVEPDDFDDAVAEAVARLSFDDSDSGSSAGPRDPHLPPD